MISVERSLPALWQSDPPRANVSRQHTRSQRRLRFPNEATVIWRNKVKTPERADSRAPANANPPQRNEPTAVWRNKAKNSGKTGFPPSRTNTELPQRNEPNPVPSPNLAHDKTNPPLFGETRRSLRKKHILGVPDEPRTPSTKRTQSHATTQPRSRTTRLPAIWRRGHSARASGRSRNGGDEEVFLTECNDSTDITSGRFSAPGRDRGLSRPRWMRGAPFRVIRTEGFGEADANLWPASPGA